MARVRHFRLHVSVGVHISWWSDADRNATRSLYILGLYENNSIHILPSVFDNDYSSQVGVFHSFLQRLMLGSGGVAIGVYWLKLGFELVATTVRDGVVPPTDLNDVQLVPSSAHDTMFKAGWISILLMGMLFGVPPILGGFWLLKNTIFPTEFSLLRPFAYLRRFVISRLGRFIKRSTNIGAERVTKTPLGTDISFPCRIWLLTYTALALMSLRFAYILTHILMIGVFLTCSLNEFGCAIRYGLSLEVARDGVFTMLFLPISYASSGFLCLCGSIPLLFTLGQTFTLFPNIREREDMS